MLNGLCATDEVFQMSCSNSAVLYVSQICTVVCSDTQHHFNYIIQHNAVLIAHGVVAQHCYNSDVTFHGKREFSLTPTPVTNWTPVVSKPLNTLPTFVIDYHDETLTVNLVKKTSLGILLGKYGLA